LDCGKRLPEAKNAPEKTVLQRRSAALAAHCSADKSSALQGAVSGACIDTGANYGNNRNTV
jgi:hypothetical protein